MKIVIVGAGAVGGYFGAKLAQAGFEVNFLARGKHLAAMRDRGIQVKSIQGDFEVEKVNATDDIRQLGPSDMIIIGVKAWQIKEIREDLAQVVHADSLVLPLQNGVLAAEELSEALDKNNILGGVCRIISKLESPGVINHFGATPSIVFGNINGSPSSRLQKLKTVFDQAGIDSRISNNIESEIWKKFAFICVGGLMAVARCKLGELRELSETRTLISELIREIVSLSNHIGVEIRDEFVDRTLQFIDTLPPDTTFSIARDIWDGKPSELDYLNGAVVRLADKYQVDTPLNRFVYRVLKLMEMKARSS